MSDSDMEDDVSMSPESDPNDPSSHHHSINDASEDADFKSELQACIDDVEYEGTFSAFHTCADYINPGLYLSGYGSVGLPLSVRDAEGIKRICKQSAFGKGDETVVDTSVRSTWELDSSDFICRNPVWSSYLDSLVSQAVKDLGVQVATRAEQYKLLLYEEGAFFKAHKDSEKVPGMFGTLVIGLPSFHTGGEVHLKHGGKQRILETSPYSSFDLSTLSWYSDVSHEVRPITSGFRLVLTYNMVQNQSAPRQMAAALDERHARLENLLTLWNTRFAHLDMFVYPLQYQYTKASLSLETLKGHDAAKGRYLEHLCAKSGVYWFLGQMTKETSEYSDGEDYDFGEDKYCSLDYTVTPTGDDLKLEIRNVSENEILANIDDLHAERSADSEDEGEFTGNESMPSRYRYHDTVLILLRKPAALEQFFSRPYQTAASLKAFFGMLYDDCTRNPGAETAEVSLFAMKRLLAKTLESLTPKAKSRYMYSYGYGSTSGDSAAFIQVFTTVASYCYTLGHTDIVERELQEVTKDSSWYSSSDLIRLVADYIAREAAGGGEDVWSKWFSFPSPPVPTYKHVDDMRNTFQTVESQLPKPCVASFNDWMGARLTAGLGSVKSYSYADVTALLNLISSISQAEYSKVILPVLVSNPHRAGAIGLLQELYQRKSGDAASREAIVKPTFQVLIQAEPVVIKITIEDLISRTLQSYMPGQSAYGYGSAYSPHPKSDASDVAPNDFLAVLKHAIALGLKDEAQRLVSRGLPQLPGIESTLWKSWNKLLDFIRNLFATANEYNDHEMYGPVRAFLIPAVQHVVFSLTKRRPVRPKNWARTLDHRCNCEPCRALHRFIINPTQGVGKFSYAEKTRKHLEYKLPHFDYKFDTERGRIPYTLVIYKTDNEFNRLNQEWSREYEAMRDELEDLKRLAQTSPFNDTEVVELLESLLRPTGAAIGSPSRPVLSSAPLPGILNPVAGQSPSAHNAASHPRRLPPFAGQKKVEVIDLGDSSD